MPMTGEILQRLQRQKIVSYRLFAAAWLVLAVLCLVLVTADAGRAAERNVRVGIYDNPPKVFIDDSVRPAFLSIF